jgi:UDP-N-acetyl-D-galactosamine dehydrogenase
LPLAVAFSRHFDVVGYDSDSIRIAELSEGNDRTNEVELSPKEITRNIIRFSDEPESLRGSNFYCVCVPTPIDEDRNPDLGPLESACRTVASVLRRADVVVFESTVYPGATEEVSIPLLEKYSGLTVNDHFYVGYSPERINPGDSKRKLENIVKVISATSPKALNILADVYGSVVEAGLHHAPNIRVAEAAKVIENTQRDLNIALMNDLANLFHKLNIDTRAVLDAAMTKWNFVPFEPGLVGGHCIGVDPYYLTSKALQVCHDPELILAGRRVNNGMSEVVADRLMNNVWSGFGHGTQPRVLVMGYTFKENCPDARNSLVSALVDSISAKGAEVAIYDPWVSERSLETRHQPLLLDEIKGYLFDGIVIAVGHSQFIEMGVEAISGMCNQPSCVFDVKGIFGNRTGFQRL